MFELPFTYLCADVNANYVRKKEMKSVHHTSEDLDCTLFLVTMSLCTFGSLKILVAWNFNRTTKTREHKKCLNMSSEDKCKSFGLEQ